MTCISSEVSAEGPDSFCHPAEVREANLARGSRQAGSLKLLLGCSDGFMADY